MRPHAKTQSSGRHRFALLLAAAAAFMLVPAAQAFAEEEAHVTIAGSGSGLVTSETEFTEEAEGEGEGTPPINCASPAPGEGVCSNLMDEIEGIGLAVDLEAIPAPGSEFVGWTIQAGNASGPVFTRPGECETGPTCFLYEEGFEDVEITATFALEAAPEFHDLTATKTGTGNGWIHSSPAGINCGLGCTTSKTASFEEGSVTLTASGAQFAGWASCPGVESGRECTIDLSEDKEAVAEFSVNHSITVTKTGTGNGWVHSSPSGINCGLACVTKTGFFEVASVTLTAYGAQFDEWTDCPGVISGRECTIDSSADESAEVEFTEPL